ncbi:MAG TPA: aldehyde dehydrogenase family protein [Bdellovibrionales bacterium]|nr:aldehyde dehydrogenase family protein [Bdellovibrionales bacterium]
MASETLPVSEERIRAMVRELLNSGETGGPGGADAGTRSSVKRDNWTPPPQKASNSSYRDFHGYNRVGFRGVFGAIDPAVKAAKAAQLQWVGLKLEHRRHIISKIRQAMRDYNEFMSRQAVSETGLGRYEDKLKKNLLVIDKTPGIEMLESHVQTGDDGLVLTEYAPYGVLGSITPTTNPTETIINNAIGMIAAANAVVFNPHPSAKVISRQTVELINTVIVENGGPDNLVAIMKDPTIESAKELMRNPGIRLIVVTGGPHVVKEAMNSGKKCIAAGPGNPPVVVDETADLVQAARDTVLGASLDNNIVCIVEKEVFVVNAVKDELIKNMQAQGAYKLSPEQTRRLEKVVLEADGYHTNKKWVGKNAGKILQEIGVPADDHLRLLICETQFDHAFVQNELLMPILPIVSVPNVHVGIELAVKAEHGFGHTAVMHSRHIDHLHTMARAVNTSIFVKNAPSYAGLGLGGEGYTSFTIASPTGEGLTTCRDFSRVRRCTLKDHFRIV